MFYLDVTKVDLNVAYVVITIHTCFKRIFQVFHLFQTYVTIVSFRCFKNKSGRAHVSSVATAVLLLGAPPWVTMQTSEAGRHLRGMHPQVGQVTGTHVGPRDGCGMGAGAACKRGMGCGLGSWDAV